MDTGLVHGAEDVSSARGFVPVAHTPRGCRSAILVWIRRLPLNLHQNLYCKLINTLCQGVNVNLFTHFGGCGLGWMGAETGG